jgi:hypothetical protein
MRPTEYPPYALHPTGLSYKVNIRSSAKPRFLAFNAAMSVPEGTVRYGAMFPERKSCHRL